jgi:capsular exopolysaccharide synthesis family protein
LSDEERRRVIPNIVDDPLMNRIKGQLNDVKNQISELSIRYTDEYPLMQQLKQKQNDLEKDLNLQIQRFMSILKSAIDGEYNINNVTLVKKAHAPSKPAGPDRQKISLQLTFIVLLMHLGYICVIHFFFRKIKVADDLKGIPNMAFLGYVPDFPIPDKKKESNLYQYTVNQMYSNTQLVDAVHDACNNVLFSMPKERNKVVICSSLTPTEGKFSVVAMLAISMANLGEKVLIVDGDLRNPVMHKAFGQTNTVGLSNCLIGKENWRDLLKSDEKNPTLKILHAGDMAPNSTALLGSPMVSKIIEEMKQDFDHIIWDLPPLLQIPDAYIMAEKADGLILIVRSEKIELNLLKEIQQKIDSLKIRLVGVIINRADFKVLFSGYYKSYDLKKK